MTLMKLILCSDSLPVAVETEKQTFSDVNREGDILRPLEESFVMEFGVSQLVLFGSRGLEVEACLALEFVLLICCYFNSKVT